LSTKVNHAQHAKTSRSNTFKLTGLAAISKGGKGEAIWQDQSGQQDNIAKAILWSKKRR
jgi:hypothetical protein